MAVSAPFPPPSGTPRRGRPRKEVSLAAPPAPASPPAPAAAPEVPPLASPPVPAAPAAPVQTAEVATVKVRHGLPVYIASQNKLLLPNHTYPVIVDRWVRHQLSLRNGAVVKV